MKLSTSVWQTELVPTNHSQACETNFTNTTTACSVGRVHTKLQKKGQHVRNDWFRQTLSRGFLGDKENLTCTEKCIVFVIHERQLLVLLPKYLDQLYFYFSHGAFLFYIFSKDFIHWKFKLFCQFVAETKFVGAKLEKSHDAVV